MKLSLNPDLDCQKCIINNTACFYKNILMDSNQNFVFLFIILCQIPLSSVPA